MNLTRSLRTIKCYMVGIVLVGALVVAAITAKADVVTYSYVGSPFAGTSTPGITGAMTLDTTQYIPQGDDYLFNFYHGIEALSFTSQVVGLSLGLPNLVGLYYEGGEIDPSGKITGWALYFSNNGPYMNITSHDGDVAAKVVNGSWVMGSTPSPGSWTRDSIYTETGNAGNYLAPQIVNTVSNGISGNIGGANTADAYSFYWPGGDMNLTEIDNPAFLSAQLFEGSSSLTLPIPLSNGPTLIDANLSPGKYVLQLTDSGADPPYEIIFNNPISSPSSVPEPSTLLLFASGLVGLAAYRRFKEA